MRVLVVDDSAVVRSAVRSILEREPDIRVVGTAADPFEAREQIAACRPDVITLDIEMPRMDGLSFLRRLMAHHPLPVVVLTGATAENGPLALRALDLGAVEVIRKPSGSAGPRFRQSLCASVRAAAAARPVGARSALAAGPGRPVSRLAAGPSLVVIGASTGGTRAVERVLERFPCDGPPCVIVQHLPPLFTASFAERLNQTSRMTVRTAVHGDRLRAGDAVVAPGDRHTWVVPAGDGAYEVRVSGGPRVNHQQPSVDVLFASAAAAAGPACAAALLTGMGRDGAEGLLAIRRAGGFTIAEAEGTCVVFGMPREAIERGAACRVAPLEEITGLLLRGEYARSWSAAVDHPQVRLEPADTPA